MIGKLYLIPTPIGNLKEVSPRFYEAIEDCSYLACEDTRNTLKLLNILNISKKCISCHEHNEKSSSINIINDILYGKTIGYLSDAGYPCISDPGYILVKEAIDKGITIVPVSGPNAMLNALVGSGLNTDHFFFYGFLSAKSSQRKKELFSLKTIPFTIIFYESPHRIKEALKDIYDVFGDRKVSIARELTKLHEEFIRDSLKNIIEQNQTLIGELVIVIEGAQNTKEEINKDSIINLYNKFLENGFSKKDSILATSLSLNIRKNELYDLLKEKNML